MYTGRLYRKPADINTPSAIWLEVLRHILIHTASDAAKNGGGMFYHISAGRLYDILMMKR
jgi:hypothetical protein